jgi:UDP-N-acetylglucosamine 2-epimerase (non-hydrolysing)
MKILSVVGARPNFMKIAPFVQAIAEHNANNLPKIEHILVHTGQHYDDRMSQLFFDELGIPPADVNLGIGSGSHAEQVGRTMIEFERILHLQRPDWVVVVGDVNATLACTVTAKKEHIKVCHIEAGLRSGDMRMPEEINRVVTDRLSDLLLTPDELSSANLIAEGTELGRIKFVGNIMIDTVENNLGHANNLKLDDIISQNSIPEQAPKRLKQIDFGVVTLHRPSNVDDPNILSALVDFFIIEASVQMPLLWSIHPRTQKKLQEFGVWNTLITNPNIIILQPLGYHAMLRLNALACLMLTDSGGLQEECTVLGTPCLTLRWTTERPITLREHGGASILVGNNIDRIRQEFFDTLKRSRSPERPALWDGKTAQRALKEIIKASQIRF